LARTYVQYDIDASKEQDEELNSTIHRNV